MRTRLDVASGLVLGLWLGANAFFSFVSAPALFRLLPRAEAGRVVASVFPKFHAASIGASALLTILMTDRLLVAPVAGGAAGAILSAGMLAAALVNAGPVASGARRAKEALDRPGGEPGVADPERAFGRWHALSMALNLLQLLLGSALGILLLRR